jgi:hypothetical protein
MLVAQCQQQVEMEAMVAREEMEVHREVLQTVRQLPVVTVAPEVLVVRCLWEGLWGEMV